MNKFIYSVEAASFKGNTMRKNEDNFFIENVLRSEENQTEAFEFDSQNGIIAAVCDGMGGEAYGEKASQLVADVLCDYSSRIKSADDEEISDIVNEFIKAANREICEMSERLGCGISGSTIALAYIKNGRVFVFNSGDSRVYFLRGGSIERITTDQTLAALKVKSKIYSEEEAERSSDRHKLMSFVGCDLRQEGIRALEYPVFDMEAGTLLICSDGLSSFVREGIITNVLQSCRDENAAEMLADIAVKNGSSDNITCIVIKNKQN